MKITITYNDNSSKQVKMWAEIFKNKEAIKGLNCQNVVDGLFNTRLYRRGVNILANPLHS